MTISDGNLGYTTLSQDAGMPGSLALSEPGIARFLPDLRLVESVARPACAQEGLIGTDSLAAGISAAESLAPLCRGVPRRVAVGPHVIECRVFEHGKRLTLNATNASIQLVLPLAGRVALRAEGCDDLLAPGAAAMLARPGSVKMDWSAGSAGLVIHLSRARVQVRASKIKADPFRVAKINKTFVIDSADPDVEPTLVHVLRGILQAEAAGTAQPFDGDVRLAAAIVAALGDSVFVRSRSVSTAVAYLASHKGEPVSLDRLAAVAGVAERTLREAFREVLGQSLPAYILGVRLEWTRERLASAMDGRSIETFARLAGYKSVSAFTKVYKDMFGETPTVTRAIAVRGESATR